MQQLPGQMSIFDLDMPYGKMFQEHSVATKERILESYSKNSAKSQTKQPMFLNLKRGNGTLVGASWGMGIPSRGECLMRDFGEFPREEEGSGLSQILEENVPLKYYLSAKACEGVLRRAERRGKELPKILETALKQQIERWEKCGNPMPLQKISLNSVVIFDGENVTSKANASNPKIGDPCHTLGRTGAGRAYCIQCYDARGNGDGKISPTITGDHNSRITDYTTLVCEQKVYAIGNGQADQTGLHKFSGALNCMHDQQAAVIAIDRAAFNQGENTKYDIGIDKTGIAQTVVAKGPGAICYCIQGNCIDRADTAGCNGKGVKENESYTLNTIDRHAVCYKEKPIHYLMRVRQGKEGGGKGPLGQENMSGTIACGNDQILFEQEKSFYVVRRLTPLECCRLQGMPDFWGKDVPHSDAQEYKMWGNGMALPNALYIMEGF